MSDLKTFVGTKTIKAIPMNRKAYNKYRGWKNQTNEKTDLEGYLVEYPDSESNHKDHRGYISWSPKEVFEKSYKCIEDKKPLTTLQVGAKIPNVFVIPDNDYGGAHDYIALACEGWDSENECSKFTERVIPVSFCKKEQDGTMVGGLQTEQLLLILIDRQIKLNDKFPCDENIEAIRCLKEALDWQQERVRARVSRGVMGQLKK